MKSKLPSMLFYLSIVLPIFIVMCNIPYDDWKQYFLLCPICIMTAIMIVSNME